MSILQEMGKNQQIATIAGMLNNIKQSIETLEAIGIKTSEHPVNVIYKEIVEFYSLIVSGINKHNEYIKTLSAPVLDVPKWKLIKEE